MAKKLLPVLLVLVLIAASLSGCGDKTGSKTLAPEPSPSSSQDLSADTLTLPVVNMDFDLADEAGVDVKEFKLDEVEFEDDLGEATPCPMEGIIAVPKGAGPHPLVVVIHGFTEIKDVHDKVYAGFDYLVRQLAAEGYVAVSFNVNIALHGGLPDWGYRIYKQHIESLESAAAGEDPGYGFDLKGKIDFNNVHIMGHSMGGGLADDIVREEESEGLDRIKSMLSIAGVTTQTPGPDIPTGFMLGEFDGEVREVGQYLFDDIQNNPARTAPASLVYLRGANHAYYNRAFIADDAKQLSEIPESLLKDRLTREQQEDFMTRYACAFLAVYAKGEAPFGIWDIGTAQPSTMFGYPVTASFYSPGRKSILPISGQEKSRLTANGGASADYLVLKMSEGRLSSSFNHPGATSENKELPLYSLRWTAHGEVSLPCDTGDFSGCEALSLYIAADSSDKLNPKAEDQSVTITLSDKAGKEQSVIIPKGTSALAYYPKEGFMPLGDLRIPLSLFDGIDLSSVSDMIVGFDQTNSGALMLSGVYLA